MLTLYFTWGISLLLVLSFITITGAILQKVIKKELEKAVIQINMKYPIEFVEWAAYNYIRAAHKWCHKYADQRKKENWKTTDQLFRLWKKTKSV